MASALRLGGLAFLASLFAAPTGSATAQPSLAELGQTPDSFGTPIYEGQVFAQAGSTPLFVYERRVRDTPQGLQASHITRSAASGEVLVVQMATYQPGFRLTSLTEVHGQTGRRASVTAGADGQLHFETADAKGIKRRDEPAGAPVVTGPTLFGFAADHWDRLLTGEVINVRFAAADRLASYPFRLKLLSTDARNTRIGFEASSPLIRMVIAPMQLDYDTATRTIRRYVGRVPPRLDGLREFDARVEYVEVILPFR